MAATSYARPHVLVLDEVTRALGSKLSGNSSQLRVNRQFDRVQDLSLTPLCIGFHSADEQPGPRGRRRPCGCCRVFRGRGRCRQPRESGGVVGFFKSPIIMHHLSIQDQYFVGRVAKEVWVVEDGAVTRVDSFLSYKKKVLRGLRAAR